jgi:hypothetical protein
MDEERGCAPGDTGAYSRLHPGDEGERYVQFNCAWKAKQALLTRSPSPRHPIRSAPIPSLLGPQRRPQLYTELLQVRLRRDQTI